jgi:hypothetical protein
MRRYYAEFNRHGTNSQPIGWSREITANAKIGVIVRVLFRKWFGRSPDRYIWHKNGRIASAEDRRGNNLFVGQYNGYEGLGERSGLLALPWRGLK